MKRLVVCVVLLWPQDDPVEAIEKRLAGALAAQAKAERDLVELGPGALSAIRERAAKAEGPLKARFLAAAKEIERRERVRGFVSPPRLVTLKADGRPLAEVVGAISTQSGAVIKLARDVPVQNVTLDLKEAPVLEALDSLCRGHGGIVARWAPELTLAKGDPTRRPRVLASRAGIELAAVTMTRASDFGADVREELRLQFGACWDPGLKPMTARLEILEIVDERGTSYADAIAPAAAPVVSWRAPATQFIVTAERVPPRDVTAFARIEGVLVLEFPQDLETLTIPSPERKSDFPAKGEAFDVWLLSFVRGAGRIETRGDLDLRALDVVAVDDGGKEWTGRVAAPRIDENVATWSIEFGLPEGAAVKELRLTRAKPGPVLKIPWKLRDVNVR